MDTEVPGFTRDMDETGARTRRREDQEHFYKRLEVMKKERVKEKIYS